MLSQVEVLVGMTIRKSKIRMRYQKYMQDLLQYHFLQGQHRDIEEMDDILFFCGVILRNLFKPIFFEKG